MGSRIVADSDTGHNGSLCTLSLCRRPALLRAARRPALLRSTMTKPDLGITGCRGGEVTKGVRPYALCQPDDTLIGAQGLCSEIINGGRLYRAVSPPYDFVPRSQCHLLPPHWYGIYTGQPWRRSRRFPLY